MHRPADPAAAEIHVVAAPTEAFFARVALLAASIRRNAGEFSDAPIIVTLSRDVAPFDVTATQQWSEPLGVSWRWVDEQAWERHGMYGSALDRFRVAFEAPFVVMLDADMVCTGPLDELPRIVGDGALGGAVAHIAPSAVDEPWRDGEPRAGAAYWNELYASVGLAPDPLMNVHSGWGVNDFDPTRQACPPYFNHGMLAGTAETMTRLGEVLLDELDLLGEVLESGFRCQLATTTASARLGIRAASLPTRWNFPNDPGFGMRYPRDAAQVRMLHYMRPGDFDRERDTASLAAATAFAARPMAEEPNELLRRTIVDALGLIAERTQLVAHG